MTPSNTIRANLSVGAVVCTIRTPEPLDAEGWLVVQTLADAVRTAAAALGEVDQSQDG